MRLSRRVVFGIAVSLVVGLTRPPGVPAAPASSSAATAPGPVGQRISLDLKGVDILDVLKLLSQKSGLNFVAGRNVSGRVTIFVNDVDVWDAFELIIGANDLAYERRGTIITVMMARDYELIYGEKFQERTQSQVIPLRYAKVVQVATVLNQIKTSVGRVVADESTNTLVLTDVPSKLVQMQEILKQLDRPTESRVYSLNYAEAEKLKEKVQELLSPVGTFTFDVRTNRVIISDLREVLQRTDQVMQAFDAPEGEVLIEAKIVNVKLTNELDLGIDWQKVFSGIDTTVRNNFDSVSGDVFATSGAATGAALKLVGSTNTNSKVIIEALKKITKTETLSNPRIMVSNNQEAKILVGRKEAFITVTSTVPATGSTVNASQVQFVDVGTKLFVTPNVKHDGHIQLKIRPEVSSTADTVTTTDGNRIPIVQTTEAETNVLVKSGTTVIIGGLIETSKKSTENRMPGLGDIPLLGLPFRGTTRTNDKSELVVFLTPQIIMPDGTPHQEGTSGTPPESLSAVTLPDSTIPSVKLQDPVPAGYRQIVRRRLQDAISEQFRTAGLSKGSVIVSFVLNREGQLTGTREILSPQGEPFRVATEQALAQAQPFPPFPDNADADEVRFKLAVDYAP